MENEDSRMSNDSENSIPANEDASMPTDDSNSEDEESVSLVLLPTNAGFFAL